MRTQKYEIFTIAHHDTQILSLLALKARQSDGEAGTARNMLAAWKREVERMERLKHAALRRNQVSLDEPCRQ